MEFNLGTLVTAIIASFLSGTALASITMLFSFSARLATFDAKLDQMKETLNKHIDSPTIVCSYHQRMDQMTQDLKTQVTVNTGKLERLEGQVE